MCDFNNFITSTWIVYLRIIIVEHYYYGDIRIDCIHNIIPLRLYKIHDK